VDLVGLLHGLETKYRLLAQKNQLMFQINMDQQLPSSIEIDDEHLSQILKQLLDNAFKFTHQGSITLNVTKIAGAATHEENGIATQLLFTLIDTGIGIAAGKLAQVFEPFTQVDSSNVRRYGGTGVGLFIAKSFAEKMGGALEINSSEGAGTRCQLTLPYRASSPAYVSLEKTQSVKAVDIPQNSQSAEETDAKLVAPKLVVPKLEVPKKVQQKPRLHGHVLYAEDNLDNQSLIKLLIETTGAKVTLAENGKQAVDAVTNSAQPFDLVLMDLQMPVMDGYEATQILKRGGCTTPIIACSASALAEIEATSEVIFDGYLGKPINKLQLYAILREYLITHEQT
jgi:CheY-like chemotaxis protein